MGDRTKIADALDKFDHCTGGWVCPAVAHFHGCHCDDGNCDRPAEHTAVPLRADPDTSDEPDWDRIFDRLPKVCPTCTSDEPTTYYGSCFDNQHSTIFDPRLPMDPWHAYMVELRHLLRQVDNLDTYVKIGREMLERAAAERDADVSAGAVARTVAMSHIAAERDAERAGRERAEAEARQLREQLDAAQLRSIEARNPGIDMDEVRAFRAGAAVAEGAEDRGQTDG